MSEWYYSSRSGMQKRQILEGAVEEMRKYVQNMLDFTHRLVIANGLLDYESIISKIPCVNITFYHFLCLQSICPISWILWKRESNNVKQWLYSTTSGTYVSYTAMRMKRNKRKVAAKGHQKQLTRLTPVLHVKKLGRSVTTRMKVVTSVSLEKRPAMAVSRIHCSPLCGIVDLGIWKFHNR